jgi:hypothetical protein
MSDEKVIRKWGQDHEWPSPEWHDNKWNAHLNSTWEWGDYGNTTVEWPEGIDLDKFPRPTYPPHCHVWARLKDGSGKLKVPIERIFLIRNTQFHVRTYHNLKGGWQEVEKSARTAYYEGTIIYEVRTPWHIEQITEDVIIGPAW